MSTAARSRETFPAMLVVWLGLTGHVLAGAPAWKPKPLPADAPVKPYRCRVVSYAGKWTRHGLSNYMAWRWPNGPLAKRRRMEEMFQITHDLDVDGDGRTDDDYVASLPFSLTTPLSNPDWPQHMAFPERRSSRFYGGVSWYVGNSSPQEARFYAEMGYNPDHSPPWYDGRAEDHPLHGQANEKRPESCHRHYWAILWTKADFLNWGDRYRVTFDDTSRLASITTRDYWLGYDDVRMIVQDGEQLWISDNEQFDIPKKGYRPARGRVFLLYPTKATWARYEPKGHLIHFDWKNATFGKHAFTDVQAVGWYLAKDSLEGKQSHVKWYGFEADAVVHRPEQGSVHIDMVEVPASEGVPAFWMSTCEVPFDLWRDAHRYGDSPFHTLEPRYVYAKDGDMGSMLYGDKPHGPDEPVTNITLTDALAWCNTLSEMEGRTPCYYVDAEHKEVFRNMHLATRAIPPPFQERNAQNPTYETVPPPTIHVKWDADGFRLPTPTEWRAAYRAGRQRERDAGVWHGGNSGGTTHPVGTKQPNALGIYDLFGNVWELCWPYGDVFDPDATEMQPIYELFGLLCDSAALARHHRDQYGVTEPDALVVLGGGFLHPPGSWRTPITSTAPPRGESRGSCMPGSPRWPAASASPYGDEPYRGHHSIGVRLVRRRSGSARPGGVWAPYMGLPGSTILEGERVPTRTAARRAAGPVLRMARLPGGSFIRSPDKKRIAVSAFDIARYPVSFAKWKKVYFWALVSGYRFSKTGDMGSMRFFRHTHSPEEPVTNITWHDMAAWCNALSEMEGRTPCFYTDEACTKVYRKAFTWRALKVSGPELVAAKPHRYAKYSYLVPQPWIFVRWDADGYRLPTEAECEYALRGGTQSRFFWGDDPSKRDEYVWSIFNAGGRTHPVGQKKPNAFGLYDIQGNVYEWLFSRDRKRVPTRPYRLDTRNPKQNPYWAWKQPKERYAPPGHGMLIAGGSWLCGGFHLDGPHGVTVDSQNAVNATFAYADLGFRVVRCNAGTHPRDGLEPMEDWPVVLKLDPKDYDPLEGAAFRGNLLRTGVHQTKGVPKLGGVKWKLPTGGPVRSSPVVVGGVVYVGSSGGHFHAIDAASGKEKWKVTVKGGSISSACVAEGVCYFGGNDGKLYAVDAQTGEVKWTAAGKGRITTSPAVAYGIVFVEGARGYDAKTGKQVWSTGRGAYRPSDHRLSSVIVWRDKLIQNGSVCDLLTARFVVGSGDPWAGQNCDALAGDALFTLNSGVGGAVNLPRLEAKELSTGRAKWSRNIVAPGQPVSLRKVVLTSPTVWGDMVYLGFDGGLLFCFDARTGKPLWTFEAGGAIRSSAAVSAGDATVYFGSHDGHLYALDAATGAERWRFKTGAKILSSPCPAAGCVYVGSDDGQVYALR